VPLGMLCLWFLRSLPGFAHHNKMGDGDLRNIRHAGAHAARADRSFGGSGARYALTGERG
jgi:hypothetical protein